MVHLSEIIWQIFGWFYFKKLLTKLILFKIGWGFSKNNHINNLFTSWEHSFGSHKRVLSGGILSQVFLYNYDDKKMHAEQWVFTKRLTFFPSSFMYSVGNGRRHRSDLYEFRAAMKKHNIKSKPHTFFLISFNNLSTCADKSWSILLMEYDPTKLMSVKLSSDSLIFNNLLLPNSISNFITELVYLRHNHLSCLYFTR